MDRSDGSQGERKIDQPDSFIFLSHGSDKNNGPVISRRIKADSKSSHGSH
jgi:hypothetical protein